MFLYEKKNSFTEKTINENVKKKYISFQKYIFTQKMFVLQTYIHIFILQKKIFLIIKNIFVKISL